MGEREAYAREVALIGEENFAKLRAAHVAVFGIGGVGSYAAEALVRAGVGALTFVDGDAVAESNLNRQLVSCIADCIDSVADKVALLAAARRANIPAVSCMGAGNRLSADFRAADIEQTSGCPLARIVRRELRKEGVTGVRAVYSPSLPLAPARAGFAEGERAIGSISFVPSAAGLAVAAEVVRILLEG